MTTSSYQSDVVVEIAFNAGFSTPEASRVWTDVSQWVELADGINIGYGRSDERSQADANSLSLTLDNSDGRFTPGRTTSPYYPNVRLYRPIRVTATPPGSGSSVRFTGFINQWPVEWSGSDAYAASNLGAASRLARLGLSEPIRAELEETILLDGPRALYTLTEPAGSVAAIDSSGRGGPALTLAGPATPALTFGEGAGPRGVPAVKFAGGQSLTARNSWTGSAAGSIECWFMVESLPPAEYLIFDAAYAPLMRVATNGRLSMLFVRPGGGTIDGEVATTSFADGVLHHLAVTVSTAAIKVYVDGLEIFSTAGATGLFFGGRLDVGGIHQDVGVGPRYAGVVSELAIYDYALTPTQINYRYTVGTSGFQGDSSVTRLSRYASYVGIDPAEIVATSLKHTHVAVDTNGQSVIELMRQIEVTESAVLYDRRDGRLALSSESVRYAVTPSFTLDMASQHVESDFAPQMDPSTILNDCTVTQVDTGVSARVVDESSRDEYGLSVGSIEATSDDEAHMLNLASWQVARYAEPSTRVPAVTVDLVAQVGKTPSPATLMLADIHTLMRVTSQPGQAAATTADYFVEGYTETIGVESYVISFNVSPGEPFTKVFILDDAVRGVLDGTYVLGL